jgi:tetratricopeptide (TPR) repeat protein
LERHALAFTSSDTVEQKHNKLEGWLVQNGFPLPAILPLFTALLSLPLPPGYAPLALSPDQQKRRTLQTLTAALVKRAAQQPVLFVMEDLHWADPSTLEFLGEIVSQAPSARLLILLTFRTGFSPAGLDQPHVTHRALTRLAPAQTQAMIAGVTQAKSLPGEILAQLVAKTDGIPLFIEELTRMVLESGLLREASDRYELTGPLPPLAIPASLQDSLVARLDRLDTTKEVVQLGSVLGREFKYDMLKSASRLDSSVLDAELQRLVDAGLFYQVGSSAPAAYAFKHALIQDAAYQQMLRGRRQQLHQTVAQAIQLHFPDLARTQPERLAHHLTEAGLLEAAIPTWQRAGQRAVEQSANAEAANHFRKALEMLRRLEPTLERLQKELELQTALGPALTAFQGFSAPEVVSVYDRARELCAQVGETPQLFPALWGTWYYIAIRPELQKSQEIVEQLLRLGRTAADPTLLLIAHRTMGSTLLAQGQFSQGLDHLKAGLALYDREQHRSLAFSYGQDIGVVCAAWAAWALWIMGYPDQARHMSEQALALAESEGHALTLSYALFFTAQFFHLCRDRSRARALATRALQFAGEHEISFFAAYSSILLGVLAEPNAREAGLTQARAAMAATRAIGAELIHPLFLAAVIDGYAELGQFDQGMLSAAEGHALIQRGNEFAWEADLLRAEGDLLLRQGSLEAAETRFRRSLDLARQQQARSYELRTSLSLCRLWLRQGRRAEAQQLLTPIHAWFTEGFDTTDLVTAQALLAEVA